MRLVSTTLGSTTPYHYLLISILYFPPKSFEAGFTSCVPTSWLRCLLFWDVDWTVIHPKYLS